MPDTDVVQGVATAPSPNPAATDSSASVPPPPSPAAHPRTRILRQLATLTRPAPPPKSWRILGTAIYYRQLQETPDQLLARLESEFPADDLLAAGVAIQADDKLTLSTTFGDTSNGFLMLGVGEQPDDAISSRGWLRRPEPPCFRQPCGRQDGEQQPVFCAISDDDAYVLHRLRFPWTFASGLERLTAREVRKLAKQFKGDGPCSQILFGWHLAEFAFAIPPGLQAMLAHLAAIGEMIDSNVTQRFRVWLPSRKEFNAIRRTIPFADAKLTRKSILASLNASSYSVGDAQELIRENSDVDLGKARDRLQKAVVGSQLVLKSGDARAAAESYRRLFREQVLSRLSVRPSGGGDPWKEMHRLATAEVAEQWFESQPLLAAADRLINGHAPDYERVLDHRVLSQRLHVADTFHKFYKSRDK